MTRSWTLRILLPIVIFLICLCSLAANSAVYKDCDDVACAKDCKRVELSGQCPYCRCKEDKDKICKRPLDEGKGLSHHTRYYFYDGRCKEFSYKGEEGNRNNFETKEDCIDYCGADECDQLNCEPNCRITVPLHGCPYCDCEDCDPVVCDESDPDCEKIIPEKGCAFCKCKNHKCDPLTCGDGCKPKYESGKCPVCDCSSNKYVCGLPADKGSGYSYLIRYYHEHGECKTFIYSGKGGNANKFKSKEDCDDFCGVTSCLSLRCEHGCEEEKVHSGCPKKCVCEDRYKICQMPVMEGFGYENQKRYYFDRKYGVCDIFYYKGKGGNYNNFDSKDYCQEYCEHFKSSEVCTLNSDPGSCEKYEKRYYYDYKTYTCKEFNYGGCYGNGNNFKTKEECDKLCIVDEDVCNMPKLVGPCFGSHRKHYYNPQFDQCEVFYYGGCYGNKNRFDSKEECESRCRKYTNICDLDLDKGSCNGQHLRYYYNKDDGKCQEFYYGGCDGNQNNFGTKYDCEHKCEKNVNFCKLSPESGPCYGQIKRYYYDEKARECLMFQYGGCEGNDNNFVSKDQCENKCMDKERVCQMKPDKGPCHEKYKRYYYSPLLGRCETFYYGGCEGNENNFEYKNECEKRCIHEVVDSCILPPEKGPCHGFIEKYYFNKFTKTCEKFYYGGCYGNKNNFDDMESCERKCGLEERVNVCELKVNKGPCEANIKRYYFNKYTRLCESFYYGGCEGNGNNFESIEYCQRACQTTKKVCELKQDKGPCHGNVRRYYFNYYTKKCEKFSYGGCEGNSNNFKTRKDCQYQCVGDYKQSEDVCQLKPYKGPCYKKLDRYYYDDYTKSCKKFVYGGCDGNGNNFETLKDCRYKCGRDSNSRAYGDQPYEDVCQLKPYKGPCYKKLDRYYYDDYTKSCKKFVYGGCDGNGNNFETLKDCRYKCGRDSNSRAYGDQPYEDVCQLKPYKGPCYKKLDRYYYDDYSKSCKKFVYGGCDGNGNNFETLKDCRFKCGRDDNSQAYGDQPYEDVCKLKPYKGPCYKKLDRYYYDDYSKSCKKFVYGGCDGNGNNFETLKDCRYKCGRDGNSRAYGDQPSEDVCQLKPYKGPCYKKLDRYYYDDYSKSCKKFVYGGCDGNGNNFETLKDCRFKCGRDDNSQAYGDQPYEDVCKLKPYKGPCYKKLDRYYYDDYSKSCKKFVYGGCDGNGNNFETLKDCRYKCGRDGNSRAYGDQPSEDVCQLKPYKGPCYKKLDRYYYDDYSKSCKKFVYGGCDGNGNNFETLKDCRFKCGRDDNSQAYGDQPYEDVCKLKPYKGPCYKKLDRYYYDDYSKSCKKFVYGGCDGNGNNFETLEDCRYRCRDGNSRDYSDQPLDVCQLKHDKGPCYKQLDRYYYDDYTKSCKKFVYGGCDGNGNNFETLEDCRYKCGRDDGGYEPSEDVCQLKPYKGPCYKKLDRYYYDDYTKSCKKFVYGGCDGNGNNFETLQDCRYRCRDNSRDYSDQISDVCQLKHDKGPCYRQLDRYYYDDYTKSCKKFVYGGCDGNGNNFETLEDCRYKCGRDDDGGYEPSEDVCQLKPYKGPCYKNLDRYYYDDYTKSCKKFVYGGCDGNGNNFETLEDCRYRCGSDGGYETSEDVCQLKHDKGPCYKKLDRYYYDDYTKSCKKFVYGGCDGNGNNFETLEDCRYKCSRDGGYEPSEDVCELKPHKGSCHGRIKRYYYSPKTGTCEMFVYGGCDGNGNNYETKDECEYQCAQSDDVCDMRPDKGPCYDIIKSYYYNTYSGDCELFYYGGCGGNGNRFATKYQCENKCIKDSDVCPALKCGPDCWEVVLPATKCPECMCPSDCTYPVGKGYGSLKLKRYYFDSKSGSCKKFYYGGKGGNKNNFKSQKSCTDNCEPEIPCEMCPEPVCEKGCWLVELNGYCPQCACPRDCLLDKDVGRCRGKLDRYYWNKAAKKCERFFYGGCEGNNNHFYTYNECQNRCASANYYSPRYDEL